METEEEWKQFGVVGAGRRAGKENCRKDTIYERKINKLINFTLRVFKKKRTKPPI